MQISRLIALAGSIITLVQTILLTGDSDGICFNDGCKVVDSLTTIPPIMFNIGGFFFFQVIFWLIWSAKKDPDRLKHVRTALLAGLSAEAVLISFQHLVAKTFCSYCLIIFSLILILNLLAGWKHILRAGVIFFTLIFCFMSLQFGTPSSTGPIEMLDRGTYGILEGNEEKEKKYLFFSSTCDHCEKVIESLSGDKSCGVRFNPIDNIHSFPLKDVVLKDEYDPKVNRSVLQRLGMQQIPVLVVVKSDSYIVISGESSITSYLDDSCFPKPQPVEEHIPQTTTDDYGYSGQSGLDFLPPTDDGCSIDTDC